LAYTKGVKCPDCGMVLVKTVVVGLDDSYRCGNCGGVWVKAWVINAMAGEPYNELKIAGLGRESVKNPDNPKCPTDNSWLVSGSGETLPPDIPMWQCGKCKCWWLPGDSVFDLADAFRIKAEFTKRWRKNSPVTSMALPVVLTVILVVGLGIAVMMVRNQQQVQVSAGTVVTQNPELVMIDNGRAEIRFKTAGDLQAALIKRDTDILWTPAYVMNEGEWKVIMADGVKPGDRIWVLLDQKVWRLTAGNKQ